MMFFLPYNKQYLLDKLIIALSLFGFVKDIL